jgi:D-lactate dehydrogenase
MAYTIAFFGTKPYDESSFNDKNKEFGFEMAVIYDSTLALSL